MTDGRLISVTDPSTAFVYSSIPPAIRAVAAHFNLEPVIYDQQSWFSRKMNKDETARLAIIEAAYLEAAGMSIPELKTFYSNARVVVLGSDTFYHISRGTFQFFHPAQVDLFLDLMESCADEYSKYCPADTWLWSCSNEQIEKLNAFGAAHSYISPTYDFISLLGKHTITKEGSYRKGMVDFIRDNGYSFTRGDSDGYQDGDLTKLYKSYLRSRFVIETSSHDNGMRSAKGFRSCVGILLGRLVLADSYPDHSSYPYIWYKYDDLSTLLDLADYFGRRPERYIERLVVQQQWCKENTIERHLIHKITKHIVGNNL